MKPAPIRAIRSSRMFFRAAYHRCTSEGVRPLLDRPNIKLGVFSMPAHPPHRPYPDVLDEDLEMLVFADPLGYDDAQLGEHFTRMWENSPAPDLLLAPPPSHP